MVIMARHSWPVLLYLGLILGSSLDSSDLLIQTLGSRSDFSWDWVCATHMGDLD